MVRGESSFGFNTKIVCPIDFHNGTASFKSSLNGSGIVDLHSEKDIKMPDCNHIYCYKMSERDHKILFIFLIHERQPR